MAGALSLWLALMVLSSPRTISPNLILLTQGDVMRALAIKSRGTLWRLRADPGFPRPIDRHGRLLWRENELLAWLDAQPRRPSVDANAVSLAGRQPWREDHGPEPVAVELPQAPRLGRPLKAWDQLSDRAKRHRRAQAEASARAGDPAAVPE